MNETAEAIKQAVSIWEAAEFYGFHPNRAGYIRCPFHPGDRQASLKLYPGSGGFCCFGCGAKGSVIDFTMLLFDESFTEACKRLNSDMRLGLPIGRRRTYREKKAARDTGMARREQVRMRTQRTRNLDTAYWAAFDRWSAADRIALHYAPEQLNGRIIPGYANAVKDLPQLAYELTLAEIERWNFEQTSGGSGLEQRGLPDAGAL